MPTNVVPFGATLEIFGGFWEGLTTLGQPHLIASFLLGHFGFRQFTEATRDQAFGQRIIFSDILRVAAVFVLSAFPWGQLEVRFLASFPSALPSEPNVAMGVFSALELYLWVVLRGEIHMEMVLIFFTMIVVFLVVWPAEKPHDNVFLFHLTTRGIARVLRDNACLVFSISVANVLDAGGKFSCLLHFQVLRPVLP